MPLQAEQDTDTVSEKPEPEQTKYSVWIQEEQKLRRKLTSSDDPRDWLFATLIPDIYGVGPDNALLNAKLVQTPSADPLIRWVKGEETKNAVTLLPQLSDFYEQHRTAALTQTLEEMAQADVYDPHTGLLINLAFGIYDRMTTGIDDETIQADDLASLKYVAAFSRAYTLLNRANHDVLIRICESPNLQQHELCASIAQKMTMTPGLLTPRIDGFCLLKHLRVAPAETPLSFQEAVALEKQGGQLQKNLLSNSKEVAKVIADWQKTGDQITVYRNLLEREGIATNRIDFNDEEECKKRFDSSQLLETKKTLDAAQAALITSLSRSWNPHDWLLAATLLGKQPADERSLKRRQLLLENAFDAAPTDALVLQFLLSQPTPPVHRGELASLLIKQEPENLASWLYSSTVLEGNLSSNHALIEKMLAGAVKSTQYETYSEKLIPLLLEKLNNLPDFLSKKTNITEEEITTYQYAVLLQTQTSMQNFPYREFSVFCSPTQREFQVEWQEQCQQIMQTMLHSPTTLLDLNIAAQRLELFDENVPDDFPDFRDSQWLTHLSLSSQPLIMFYPELIREHLAAWQRSGNEVEVIRAFASSTGFPLLPPADWQYPGEGLHERNKQVAKRVLADSPP